MAETLDTLAERITALTSQMVTGAQLDAFAERITGLTSQMATRAQLDDVMSSTRAQLEDVKSGFRAQLDDVKSGLRTQIEAVDAKVGLVLEKVDHLIKRDIYHSVVHARFDQRLEDHELRLMSLESSRTPPASHDE